jgi:cbb3-type cytochrome oxidase maturation protein
MPLGLWLVAGWMLLMALTGIALLFWGWRTGQFRDVEEPKYRMLEDRDPEPWPGREVHAGLARPAKGDLQ